MDSHQYDDCTLLVFVKHPIPGEVKTRLAADIGDEKAVAIYRRLLSHTEAIVADLPVETFVYYGNELPEQDLWSQSSRVDDRLLQQGDDLGARMKAAFIDRFQAGKQRVIVIGSDCAELKTSHIVEAFRALSDNDAVIGPANDGGYYLLGLTRMVPTIFSDMNWSTEHVYKSTLRRFKKERIHWFTLPMLTDIDEYEDWQKTGHNLS
jgi:rSAM/selenodomain-associated transferase 1